MLEMNRCGLETGRERRAKRRGGKKSRGVLIT
jgi:hypothetical protein